MTDNNTEKDGKVMPQGPAAPKVALALGGGVARGFAHIGVLEVLAENTASYSGG